MRAFVSSNPLFTEGDEIGCKDADASTPMRRTACIDVQESAIGEQNRDDEAMDRCRRHDFFSRNVAKLCK
jgi:hypothetical protein